MKKMFLVLLGLSLFVLTTPIIADATTSNDAKCGAGKCASGKCGQGKCASGKCGGK